MAEHPRENSSERLYDGGAGQLLYLGEKGESFFIRASGKGDVKVVNLINRAAFALADVFFTSEEEARLFAEKRNLRIVDYDDNACSAPSNQDRSSQRTTTPPY